MRPVRLAEVLLIVLVVSGAHERFFLEMARAGILTNLVMWAFNLFPLPPLDGGRILVGLQVPQADGQAFEDFIATLGYPHVEETQNPIYRLFLQD